MQQFVISYS